MTEPQIGDEITLVKSKEDAKKVTLTKTLESAFQLGGSHDKVRVEAVSAIDEGENMRKMSLIIKEIDEEDKTFFPSETKEMSQAERYMEKWNILRSNGIPTVSSMRIIDRRTVALGDMTVDGSKFFGKEIAIRVYERQYVEKRSLKIIEEVFLKIDPLEIKKEIERIQRLAWDKGIILPDNDPYDLLVHPDGTWEVLVLDITQLRPRKEDDSEEEMELQKADMWENIDVTRDYLLKVKSGNERD